MINFIGCIIAFGISLLLSKIDALGDREIRILTLIGWAIALYFSTGDIND